MWSALSQGTPLLARELHSLYPAPLSSTAIGDHTLPLLQHYEAEQLTATNLSHSANTAHACAHTHTAAPVPGLCNYLPQRMKEPELA